MNSANSIFDTDSEQKDFNFTSAGYHNDPVCIVGGIPKLAPVSFFDDDRDWRTKLKDKFLNFMRKGCD